MIKINFNPSVLGIQTNLAKSTNALSVALERMSTGYKINSAKDDAAGLYVATRLNSRLSGLKVASNNIANALSMLNTAESSLVEMTNSLDRIRDLTVQASNGTYNSATRKMMQDEIDTLLNEITRTQDTSSFNKLSIFSDNVCAPHNTASSGSSGKFISQITRLTESEAIAQGYSIIKTAEDLNNIRNDLGGKYILMGNIDLSSYDNWTPIGDTTNNFTGVLDGNGYVISNLTIDKASANDIGFFGACDGAELKNIGIISADIKGSNRVGILSASCSNSTIIENCFAQGSLAVNFSFGGGLIGNLESSSSIRNSYADVNMYTKFILCRAGGLVGQVYENCLIDNCFTTGKVFTYTSLYFGGIAGWVDGMVKNSYSFCNIDTRAGYVGGLAGTLGSMGIIENCFYDGAIKHCNDPSVISHAAGIVAEAQGIIRNCFSTGLIDCNGSTSGIVTTASGNALIENSYSNMELYSGESAAGIAHLIRDVAIVRNCYSSSSIVCKTDDNVGGGFGLIEENSLVENCFSTGRVVCESYTTGKSGGLYGSLGGNATIRNSAWCIDTSGTTKEGSIQAGSTATLDNVRGISSSQLDSDFYTDMSFDESIWDFSGELPILKDMPSFGAYYSADILRRLQIGDGADMSSMLLANTTLNLDLSGISVLSTESSKNSIDKIDKMLAEIADKRSDIGVIVSNLELIKEQNMTTVENLTSAVSTIMDADIAEESAGYVKQRILSQTTSTLLSQATSMNLTAILSLIK